MLKRLGTPELLASTALLVGFGLVMVYSASAIGSELRFGEASVYLERQLAGVALGVLGALAIARIPLAWLQRTGLALWAAGLVALAATLSPLGVEHNGATRWVALGGFEFQPLEIAKLGLVLGLAQWLAVGGSRLEDYRLAVGVPLLLTAAPAGLLLLQPDFGGALMLVIFAGALLFAAGVRAQHLGLTALVALPGVVLVAVYRPYRLLRLESFLDPWSDPMGQGYQLVQSLLAFGAGGPLGVGLGAGQQKLGYLPEAHTDFILSVVGEETGLIGVAAVLIVFAILGLAAIGVAYRARDAYAMLVAFGAGLLLWLQGLVNAGVALGALPTKGTTLPLISYGRTSLVTSLVVVGLLCNVARPRKRGRTGWR